MGRKLCQVEVLCEPDVLRAACAVGAGQCEGVLHRRGNGCLPNEARMRRGREDGLE